MVTLVKIAVAFIKIQIFFVKIFIHDESLLQRLEDKLASYGE